MQSLRGGTVADRSSEEHPGAMRSDVRIVVYEARDLPARTVGLTTCEALAGLIAQLPPHGVLSVERIEDPSAFAMASPLAGGRFQVWYESSRGYAGADTVRACTTDAAKALYDWAVEAKGWQDGFSWEHKMPVPDRIPIAHEPGCRTDLIGTWDDGLFFAGYCGMTYLHLFDHDGNHVRSDIRIAEEALGTADVHACMSRLREVVTALPGHRFGDIAVRLFCVEYGGSKWGLFDLTAEHAHPHVEMEPDCLGFRPPWNGLYDT